MSTPDFTASAGGAAGLDHVGVDSLDMPHVRALAALSLLLRRHRSHQPRQAFGGGHHDVE